MTKAEGDRMAAMVVSVLREIEEMRLRSGEVPGYDDTYIYIEPDVAGVVYGRAGPWLASAR